MVIRNALERLCSWVGMKNVGMQCGEVLWRREVAENDVEAESKKGGTYDLTFESSLR
jgi:hypothetical protein